jgi:hypothetical protein
MREIGGMGQCHGVAVPKGTPNTGETGEREKFRKEGEDQPRK